MGGSGPSPFFHHQLLQMKKKKMVGKTVEYWPTSTHKETNWEKRGIDPDTVRRKGIIHDQWKDVNRLPNYLVQPDDGKPLEIVPATNLHRIIVVALFIGLSVWALI